MKLIVNKSTAPAFNLALEEHALCAMADECIILWRNARAVIIGCNQNTAEEIDADFIEEHAIPVIRRQSGGGAVFHDLGNVNFTLVQRYCENDLGNYEKFTQPIIDFLAGMGVVAKLEGRNDLCIDSMKFSGNAQAVKNGRIMHHGTILYDADFSLLAGALRPKEAKIASKAIKSVRSRVTNVAAHLAHLNSPPPVEAFFTQLCDYFADSVPEIERMELTVADIAAVDKLVTDKYGTWEWNFGRSPAYNFQKSCKFPYGLVELRLLVSGGVIEQAHIFGDFFSLRDKAELEQRISGIRHDAASVASALEGVAVGDYISGAVASDLLSLF